MALPAVPFLFAGLFATFRVFLMGLGVTLIQFLVRYVLVALGIGLVTYVGADLTIQGAFDFLTDRFEAVPQELFDLLVFMGVKDFLSILSSAVSMAVTIRALATMSRFRLRNGPAWTAPGTPNQL